jgi:hypothetical protein
MKPSNRQRPHRTAVEPSQNGEPSNRANRRRTAVEPLCCTGRRTVRTGIYKIPYGSTPGSALGEPGPQKLHLGWLRVLGPGPGDRSDGKSFTPRGFVCFPLAIRLLRCRGASPAEPRWQRVARSVVWHRERYFIRYINILLFEIVERVSPMFAIWLTANQKAKRSKLMAKAATQTSLTSPSRADGHLYAPHVFNKRSRQRFSTDRQRRWQAHAGRADTQAATLISQLIALEWDVLRLEARENEKGKLSAHDRIALATWRRHFREALRQLGPPATAKPAGRTMDDLRREARGAAA